MMSRPDTIFIKDILKGKVLILCLGNIERGDDGVGSRIASAIKGKLLCEVIDAGVTPENYTGVIKSKKPDTIIIVDSVYFEGEAGEVRLFSGDELHSGKISTHDVSPKLLIEYLNSSINAGIYILGIRPRSNEFGRGLSKEVEGAVEKVGRLLLDNVKRV